MSLRRVSIAAILLGLLIGFDSTNHAQAAEDNPVKACFEGAARTIADAAQGKDELTRNLAEMKAGRACDEFAVAVIGKCLAEVDASGDDAKDYYPCIGTVANVCLDSDFATTEFRKVVCIGSEEKVWLDLVHEHFAALKARLRDEARTQLQEMEKTFFAYRDQKCGLFRMVFEGDEPHVAYSACAAETAARLAIDLRELKAKVEASARSDASDAQYPGTREGAEKLLSRYLAKGADYKALTGQLEPSPEDYAAVYSEPLARRLREAHAKAWAEGLTIQPEVSETELRITFSMSDRLAQDSEARSAFPGGYERVLPLMKPGIPIVAFKFVQPGQTLGKSFDGVVHVNGRWVLIPKPWRQLD